VLGGAQQVPEAKSLQRGPLMLRQLTGRQLQPAVGALQLQLQAAAGARPPTPRCSCTGLSIAFYHHAAPRPHFPPPGCDLCGRVLRRRGTRMCVHCTETWCLSCIDRVGTCGCGELTEEGFLRPMEEVEAPALVRGAGPPVPCLSTASSCNLAVCMADTATSEPAGAVPAAPPAAAPATLFGAVHSCSGSAADAATAMRLAPAAAAAAAAAGMPGPFGSFTSALRPVDLVPADGGDEDGPQCSSTGGGGVC
jgi:hypothetical protein